MATTNINKHLLLAGVLFTVHNAEEVIGFYHFTSPKLLKLLIELPEPFSMAITICTLTLLVWIFIVLAISHWSNKAKQTLFKLLVIVFAVNAFIPHIIGTLMFWTYMPGVVTSVILYLPYSYWVYKNSRSKSSC